MLKKLISICIPLIIVIQTHTLDANVDKNDRNWQKESFFTSELKHPNLPNDKALIPLAIIHLRLMPILPLIPMS